MQTWSNTPRLRPLLGVLFFLGPILLVVGGIFAAMEPVDTTWQGVFGQFGAYCLIPTYLAIAGQIAATSPRLGTVCTVVGWLGAAAAVQAFSAYFAVGLAGSKIGFDARPTLAAMAEDPSTAMLVGGLVGMLVPLSMVLLGIGLFASKATWRAGAILVCLAGVVFMTSQAVFNNTGEWISPLLLLAGIAPMGWQLLAGQAPPEMTHP